MALVSPGVQITVTDQSNYAPTALGSVAYVLLATAQDKPAPGGTAIAAGTLEENAGKVYQITSQRDLVTTFGNPIFKTTSSGAAINAGEQNEYGLLAAYSALGVSNVVYVQRANVDLGALTGTTIRPLAFPANGTYWLDTGLTNWGIYQFTHSTGAFTPQPITIINDADLMSGGFPLATLGALGDFAVDVTDPDNPIFQKVFSNSWKKVGTNAWQSSLPVVLSSQTPGTITANGNVTINGTNVAVTIGQSAAVVSASITTANITGVYSNSSSGLFSIGIDSTSRANGTMLLGGTTTVLDDLYIRPGTYNAPAVQTTPYYSVPEWQGNLQLGLGYPTGSIWQKTSQLGNGLNVVVKEFNATTSQFDTKTVPDYANVFAATYGLDPTGGGTNINQGTLFAQYAAFETTPNTLGNFLWYRKATGATIATANSAGAGGTISVGNQFTIKTVSNIASGELTTYTVTISTGSQAGFVQAVGATMSAANNPYVTAEVNEDGNMTLSHSAGSDMIIDDTSGTVLANIKLDTSGTNIYTDAANNVVVSNWQPLSAVGDGYRTGSSQPYDAPANDKYWYYNTPARADILYNNGSAWLGYRSTSTVDIRGYNLQLTNTNGPIISATAPTKQDDGTSSLQYGDLWLDTSDLENYPNLYRWQRVSGVDQWILIDNTDSTSQNGIIFADARWATSGNVDPVLDTIPTIRSLSTSSYLDLDAPDPTLYPRGMLMWNTRASGYNVKEYKSDYFTEQAYPGQTLPTVASTWVTVSGYNAQGLPNFGRKAQRGVVVAALKASIDSSTALREDQNVFNIIACPGYPELIPNMTALNEDRNNTGFIIGDTPMRLPATGTDIQAWATNSDDASATSEEGLTTVNPYVAVYYPSGQTNDLSGATVAVPPSYAALRAYIKSDNISFPWFAPAGTRRGIVDNLSSIGYVDPNSGQFIQIGVTQGLRDVMYTNKINPITNLPTAGILLYGQKTLSSTPSSLDRINVARLVAYLRAQLNTLANPFIFEPNDPITRKGITAVINSLLNDLVAKRGITDYLVICDGTNNTPDRIARNELYVDVAIQPTKDVEFIYIPIRLKNPGEIQAGNLASATTVGTGA